MCGGCGTHRDDWIDPVSGYRYREPRWIVEVRECPGCAAVEAEMSAHPETTRAHRVTLRPSRVTDFVEVDG